MASTDADSIVRADWLTTHLQAAQAGWDAYAGEVVVLDWDGWSAALPDAYERHYRHPAAGPRCTERTSAFASTRTSRSADFRPWPAARTQILVDRLIDVGYSVLASPFAPVHTSARRVARVRGGFSTYLGRLEEVEASAAGEQPEDDCLQH